MFRMVLLPEQVAHASVAVPLREGQYIVGRSRECDIVVSDKSVSRRHARLTLTDGVLAIADLGSRNGTFVDDCQISLCTVRVRQIIRFGSAPYRVALEDGATPVSTREDDETFREAAESQTRTTLLTPSQSRVYDLLLDGVAEAEIAARLNLSVHTVHTHVKAIYTQFNVHSRAELLARRLRESGTR